MSAKKFKFVSPGVFVDEIDNSQLPETPEGVGPVIIGRTARGPAMVPVQVNSFSDFVETFGNPVFGGGVPDAWRAGPNSTAPTYASYAAQAYLRNQSPITVVKLAGIEDANPTANGGAGWVTNSEPMDSDPANGGAYGLFLVESGSSLTALGTGSLAAIFYCSEGVVELTGTLADGVTAATGTAGLFLSDGTPHQYTAQVRDTSGVTDKVVFNFNENSKLYIRNVFNTNPTLVNTFAGDNEKKYFLGETFDRNITDKLANDTPSFGVILGLKTAEFTETIQQNQQSMVLSDASTGWFFSQDLGDQSLFNALTKQKLFKLETLSGGEWAQGNLKISITSIKASPSEDQPYGTFSVQVRKASDSDARVSPVETYSDVNLNPNSPDFIARRIGDSYRVWDDGDKRYQTYGNYVNQSRYIRVVLDPSVDAGTTDPKFLPFGVYGPTRYQAFQAISNSTASFDSYVVGGSSIPRSLAAGSDKVNVGTLDLTASFDFPEIPTRTNSDDSSLINQKDVYFGATTNVANSSRLQRDIVDYVRRKPGNADDLGVDGSLNYSWLFTLDDVSGSNADGVLGTWESGSRIDGTSITAQAGNTYESVLSAGFNKFTTMLQGGFEGIDILEREPFANRLLTGMTSPTDYAYASIERAINTVADPDVVQCNMLSMPGVTNEALTGKLLDVAETRGDALAIVDLKGGYEPETESAASLSARLGSVSETITNLNNRNINNSYGCAYYPWVQITDTVTTGGSLWVPPSVAVLGTLASSQASSELWFAPAGFTRGGLTEGSAGLPVTNVRERLTSDNRDDLYTANINPIAQFPAEGIVVFGQKTLQVTPSALDRINVRRMLIYVKRQISFIASRLLFDQNVQSTWTRFTGEVNPFLGSVKTRLGLTDYKVILDSSTTTDDLVDRNIMYAKILLKPAKALEFIALDFVVTRSGASFDD
tara:strand:+ start:30119 stop:32932 length:2814 start_codon:yes stop_codon:yes gene_type:complete